jgi:glycosyltransferase involved in cell wall biosynthesis
MEAVRCTKEKTDKVHFYIVGDGAERDHLVQLSKDLDIGNLVTFTGYRNDALQIMRRMDVVVNPSVRPEPLGRVIIEAMFFGIPVIATNNGAPTELIEDGKTGFLVEPGKPEQIVTAICSLWDDEGLRKKVGEAARAFVVDEFDDDVLKERFDRFFERL